MRLYDQFATGRGFPNPYTVDDRGAAMASQVMTGLQRVLPGAARIDIQNVADYMYMGTDQEEWEWETDFPNLAPPFESFWMEWTQPKTSVSREMGVTHYQGPDLRIAVFWEGFQREDGWTLRGSSFSGAGKTGVGPNVMLTMEIRPDGSLARLPQVSVPHNPRMDEPGADARGGEFLAAGLAISFMHCKNVALEDAPPAGTRQQRRAEQRQGIEHAQFKTLIIDPMKKVLRTEGGIEKNGLKKALHICRGHFATYTEDKPLFGRHVGTFWKPAHVRGSADAGTVYKDYRVKPGEMP